MAKSWQAPCYNGLQGLDLLLAFQSPLALRPFFFLKPRWTWATITIGVLDRLPAHRFDEPDE